MVEWNVAIVLLLIRWMNSVVLTQANIVTISRMAAIRRRSALAVPKSSKHSAKFFFFLQSENDPLLDNFCGLNEQNVSELNKVSGSATPVGGGVGGLTLFCAMSMIRV